jgi:hypothetical protein
LSAAAPADVAVVGTRPASSAANPRLAPANSSSPAVGHLAFIALMRKASANSAM